MIKKHFYTVLFSLFSLFVVCRQPANEDLLIRPGDTLTIEVKQMRSFNKKYLVNSQGVIALRKWGELYVDGLTVEDAQEKVINFFAKKRIDRNAEVKIQLIKVASSSKIQEQANAGDNINPKNVVNVSRDKVEPVYQKSEGVIHITGAVKKIAPQVYRPELALSDALHQAGITSESKIDAIEIISTKGEKKTIAFHCEQPKGSTSNPYLQIGDLVRIPNISEKSQQKKLFEVLPISQDEIIEISPTSKPQALIDIQVEKEEEVVDDVQMITPRIQPTDTPMPISAKHEISKSADDQYLEQIVDKPSGISGEDLENSVQNNFNNHQANTF
jgi:protein involved in polysaccharide export with SLBB domain